MVVRNILGAESWRLCLKAGCLFIYLGSLWRIRPQNGRKKMAAVVVNTSWRISGYRIPFEVWSDNMVRQICVGLHRLYLKVKGRSCRPPVQALQSGKTSTMASRKGKFAPPGCYLILGRKDDTDEIVYSVCTDIPLKPKLTALCRRALYESGINDPLVYEFLAMFYTLPNGGVQIVLDQSALRRYVHANYG